MTLLQNSEQGAIRHAIQEIAVGPDRGRDIERDHARQVMHFILSGQADDVQSAVFLIGLRMKRESINEFSGLLDALQTSYTPVTAKVNDLLCLADPFNGYARTTSMTPFIAPVLAANGMAAMMHGVETVGPKHGVTAHKVYRLAGMNALQSTAKAVAQLEEIGCAYLDQSMYSPSLFNLQSLRDRMVKRTALTTLERLLTPIRAVDRTHLVLGYVHKAYPEIYTRAAQQAGYKSVLLLKGVEGGLAPSLNKPLRQFFFEAPFPEQVDEEKQVIELGELPLSKVPALKILSSENAVEECLQAGLNALKGQPGVARDSLALAAGQILFTHNESLTLVQAVEKVQNCLDNGSALARFDAMISNT